MSTKQPPATTCIAGGMAFEASRQLALPLLVDADGHHAVIVDGSGDRLFSNNDEFLGMGGTPQKAAEIVRRVNLHDELVEALRKTISALHRDRGYLPNCPVQLAAHTVLAKVEGR